MSTEISSWSRRGFLRVLAVGVSGCALGSLLIPSREAMAQSIEGHLGKIPMEARWGMTAGSEVYNEVNWKKTLLDKEGRENFTEYMKMSAPANAAYSKGLADRFGLMGRDAEAAAAIISAIVTVWYGPQQRFEIEEATAEKARVKCLECAFWNDVQAKKIADDLCSVNSQYYWEGFAKALNPRLSSTLVKARPLGDAVCEWIFELKA